MQLDPNTHELTIKLVFYGPALSGKTTNLQAIYGLADSSMRGRLMTLETRDDRTLFFDLLPLRARFGDLQVRLKLFTVPGQAIHATTRKLVLTGVDGIVFVADSRVSESAANAAAFKELEQTLQELNLDVRAVPLVLQFNKRDLPNVRTDAEIDALAGLGSEPVFKAIATKGTGVVQTLLGILDLTWKRLEREHELLSKYGISGQELLNVLQQRLSGSDDRASTGKGKP